ncbi:hypothetical protein Hanom_Chr06g00514161 [Helianthus anomalus]
MLFDHLGFWVFFSVPFLYGVITPYVELRLLRYFLIACPLRCVFQIHTSG